MRGVYLPSITMKNFRYFKRLDGSIFKKNLVSAERNAKGYLDSGCVEVDIDGKELNPKPKSKPKPKAKPKGKAKKK